MRTVAILSAPPRVLVGLSDYGQDALDAPDPLYATPFAEQVALVRRLRVNTSKHLNDARVRVDRFRITCVLRGPAADDLGRGDLVVHDQSQAARWRGVARAVALDSVVSRDGLAVHGRNRRFRMKIIAQCIRPVAPDDNGCL